MHISHLCIQQSIKSGSLFFYQCSRWKQTQVCLLVSFSQTCDLQEKLGESQTELEGWLGLRFKSWVKLEGQLQPFICGHPGPAFACLCFMC